MNDRKQTLVDPVCGMRLRPEQVKQSLVFNDEIYQFCSVGCRAEFQRHPEDYIGRTPKEGGTEHV